MAGDWIKMRGNLWDDPRVAAIVDATETNEAQVIGGLYWLWATADQHTETGIMPGLSLRQIDRKTGIKGFGEALVAVGWIADHPEGIRIVNFEEHNGASAKRRATTAKRVATHRSGNADSSSDADSGNAGVTQAALPNRDASVTGALAREREEKEKRKRNTPLTPQGGAVEVPEWVPAEPWTEFVQMRRAKGQRTPFTVGAAKGVISKLETFRDSGIDLTEVLRQSTVNGWADVYEPKVKAAAPGVTEKFI